MPSIPDAAPLDALTAELSNEDRLVLMLLIEAFARVELISTTSSSLLSAAIIYALPERLAFFGDDPHGVKYVDGNFFGRKPDSELSGVEIVERSTDHQAVPAEFRGVKFVQRTITAALLAFVPVVAQAWATQFLAPQGPMHDVADRG
jgi:hypothetical protein